MSRQNSRDISGISVTLDGHEIGIDRVANTTLPFSDVKVLLKKGEKGDSGEWADITIIAPAFSETTAYAVGDYVTKDGKLYKCTAAHSAGAWNASHFTVTSVDGSFMAQGRDYVTAGRAANSSLGTKATAEGSGVTASGQFCHAEGDRNASTNKSAHSEGQQNTAGASASHAEGYLNTISSGGLGGHAEGYKNTVSAYYAHGEGENNTVSHRGSHVEGYYNQSGAQYQHISGQYNVGKSTTLLEVGNGTSGSARANAFEVASDGDITAGKDVIDGSGNVLKRKPNLLYGTTSSTSMTTAKTATLDDSTYTPVSGDIFLIRFENGNSAETFTLDINSSGAKPVVSYDIASTYGTIWFGSRLALLRYDGTKYEVITVDFPKRCQRVNDELRIVDANSNAKTFNGSNMVSVISRNQLVTIESTGWSGTVDADGYYTNTVSVSKINTYNPIYIACCGSTKDTLPTAAQAAAFSLCNMFHFDDGVDIQSMTVKAKTKPTETFYVLVQGSCTVNGFY
jgi:hypothetical protein